MGKPLCTDKEFIDYFRKYGAAETARHFQVEVRVVFRKRRAIEQKLGESIESPIGPGGVIKELVERSMRRHIAIKNGVVLIGSDFHYWPGIISTAHRAFLQIAHDLNPAAIILNGDVFEGAKISRHPPLGWQKLPTVKEEMDAVRDRVDEIRSAAPENCQTFWNYGNHCMRFENALAQNSGGFEGVQGFRLSDHYPGWVFQMSLWINNDTVVKHRYKGGIHATHNNAVMAGKSVITGHLHSSKVTPYNDYNGIRYGVDSGTMADPFGPQFDYQEDNPRNHRSGFVVLTFHDGMLLMPELVTVIDEGRVQFRGQIIKV